MLGPGCDLFGCLWSKLTLGIKGTSENFTSPLQVQHYPYSSEITSKTRQHQAVQWFNKVHSAK